MINLKQNLRLQGNSVFRLLSVALMAMFGASSFLESAVAKPNIKGLRVKAVGYSSLPGWKRDDHAAAFKTFLLSCSKMSSGGDRLARACRVARKQPRNISNKRAKAFFESYFTPHQVHSSKGLLTGYYEPEMYGSRVRTSKFKIPLYRRPRDLMALNSKQKRRAARRAGLPRKLTYAMRTRKGLSPYLTREQIESGGLDGHGLEMLWLADPVDVFFLHIQGSGRIVLPDGSRMRVGFDGKNGYGYSSVGRLLVRNGLLSKGGVTLDSVKTWLRKNPKMGRKAMWHNKSFIFFRELPDKSDGSGPIGAQGIALVAGRSLAVDRRHYRLGLPIFLSVPHFRKDGRKNLRRLMVAQDTGTAIKGARRGDIFWGSGHEAGNIAGRTYHKGQFYVLLPRNKPQAIGRHVEKKRLAIKKAGLGTHIKKAVPHMMIKKTASRTVIKKVVPRKGTPKKVARTVTMRLPIVVNAPAKTPARTSERDESIDFSATATHAFSQFKSGTHQP